jgi:hypothetical protein
VNQSTQRIIRNKIGLLNLAEELGNVSKACQMMGVSRDTFEAKPRDIQVVYEHVYNPNRAVFSDIFVQTLGEQGRLVAIFAFDEAAHDVSSNQKIRLYWPGSFHTA